MAIDYSKFEGMVDLDALQKDIDAAKVDDYEDVPDGTYIVTIERMEQKETKAGDKLMFSIQCKIVEGEHKGRSIFWNCVVLGNKKTEKWHDGKAVKLVRTWLEKLNTETTPEFYDYPDFEIVILDMFQEIQGKIELEIEYKAKNFVPITIKEVFDL